MFKIIKPIWLVIILIILVAIYFVINYTAEGDRNFRSKMIEFNPKSITEVLVTIPDKGEKTHLLKEGGKWKVYIKDKLYRADTNSVGALLDQLSRLETKRFAGRGKDNWVKYELTDTTGVNVKLYEGKKEIADLMVGKFDYTQSPQNQPAMGMRQQQGEMSTYVRLSDEKEVYVVDGFLKMAVGRQGEAFRDKTLVGVLRNDINRVSFNYSGETMNLEKTGTQWMLNGNPADSAKSMKYIATISRLAGQEFIYDNPQTGNPTHTVTIEGNNFSPIEINAYPVADTNYRYVLISSKNPEAMFSGKKSDLFKRLMVGKDAFLADEEDN
jgi:hypothetical protein